MGSNHNHFRDDSVFGCMHGIYDVGLDPYCRCGGATAQISGFTKKRRSRQNKKEFIHMMIITREAFFFALAAAGLVGFIAGALVYI
jgi:hypothetical protein